MPACLNCGNFVSHSFARVFGDDGQIAACPNCNDPYELAHGEGIPSDDG
jgi:hypothetical protein